MDRRTLFALTGATAAATLAAPKLVAAAPAAASTAAPAAVPKAPVARTASVEPRGRIGQLKRLPSLAAESNQEFLTEVRTLVQRSPEGLFTAAKRRAVEVLRENGYEPDARLPVPQVVALMEKDPTLMASARAWLATQELTWSGVKDAFDANRSGYLAELRAAQSRGPGSLELQPAMHIPEYARHEIHIQPGGYVGDPLAGYIYHYGTNNFFMGHNTQDEYQVAVASAAPLPKDRKVRRILEFGCSCGQTAVALKRRFPDAEVWAVDVGGPMVHYAHMRASDLGVAVNFRQSLAEATGFPDGHFDMIVSFIVLHEVPNAQNTQIMKEVSRMLRGGGTYYPVDFYTATPPPTQAYGIFHRWWDHRWNNEPWALEHMDYDLAGDLTNFGMQVTRDGPPSALGGKPNLFAVKNA